MVEQPQIQISFTEINDKLLKKNPMSEKILTKIIKSNSNLGHLKTEKNLEADNNYLDV